MSEPFHFQTRSVQIELLGRKARGLDDLREGVRSVPESSIFYHTHRYLDQHQSASPEPPNDFAYWAAHALSRDGLAEKLAALDTVEYRTIESLREGIAAVLESFALDENTRTSRCQEGEEFHFMSCRMFVRPTEHTARGLREFLELLRIIPPESLAFHVFESRLLFKDGEFGFARWFRSMGEPELARAMEHLDPYTATLEGLRRNIVRMVTKHAQNA